MKKPRDWETFSSYILNAFIHELNIWNAMQDISNALHTKHFKEEIQPLITRRDKLSFEFINKYRKTDIETTHDLENLKGSI